MSTISLSPNPASGKNYVIFPDSPYLLKSIVLSIVATAKSFSPLSLGVSTPLVMGVDYFPAFLYNRATGELGEAVYAGVSMVDPALEGTITYSFTEVGNGEYTATTPQINSIYADNDIDPVVARWDDVVTGLPTFPHTTLLFDATARVGVEGVITKLNGMQTEAAAAGTGKSIFDFTSHIANHANPHNDSANSIQLGSVPNWIVGSAASIIAGGSQTEFATPLSVKDSVALVMPQATVVKKGVVALNQGNAIGDPTNATDGLTAAGLVYMLENDLLDSGATLVDNQRHKVVFNAFPIVYPATWNGVVCNTFEALVQAVQAYTGISELTANAAEGAIYFPRTATAPSLAHT
jgi:hypothetical protein